MTTYISPMARLLEGIRTLLLDSSYAPAAALGLGTVDNPHVEVTQYEIPIPSFPFALIAGGIVTDSAGDARGVAYVVLYQNYADPRTAPQQLFDYAEQVRLFLSRNAARLADGVAGCEVASVDMGMKLNANGEPDTAQPVYWITLELRPEWLED